MVKSCHAIFLEDSTGHTFVQCRTPALVALKLCYPCMSLSSYHSVRIYYDDKFGQWYDYKFNHISRQDEWVRLDELTALSRPGASLWPGRASHCSDYLAINLVQASPTLCASEPVACLACIKKVSRDFVTLDRPFDDGSVQTANVAVRTFTAVSTNKQDTVAVAKTSDSW